MDFLIGQKEFEESTLSAKVKARYRKAVKSRKGKCLDCDGPLDRYGLICQRCYGMVMLPFVEREAMRAVNGTRERELLDIYRGLRLV